MSEASKYELPFSKLRPSTWKFQGRKAVIEDKEKKLQKLENELTKNVINFSKLKELIKNKDLNKEFKNLKLTRILNEKNNSENESTKKDILKKIRNKKNIYNKEKNNLNKAKSLYIKAKETDKNQRSFSSQRHLLFHSS